MKSKQSYREVMGERLRAFRLERGLSVYAVAKRGGIRIDQVHIVERGDTNYTIDIFTGYIVGCELYMYFSEKSEGREKPHDFSDLLENMKCDDPNL